MNPRPACAGVILAGGRSERMGGACKALVDLQGRPMIAHVIDRLSPQVGPLLLSVDQATEDFGALGLPLVPDVVRSHRGPLTGLFSALQHLADSGGPDWLLLSPCDAPFLPADLAGRLLGQALQGKVKVASAAYGGHPQPTFSVWHHATLPEVRAAVLERGRGGLMHMLDQLAHVLVDWPEREIPPFFNVNSPADQRQALAWLDRAPSQD